MRTLANYLGSVEDIRCTVQLHTNPRTREEVDKAIRWLEASLKDEKETRNRITVIKIIETKLKKLRNENHYSSNGGI